jgi:hypothetical protein
MERMFMIVHTTSLDQLQAAAPILIPLLIAELALVIFCLVDLLRADRRVRGNSKLVWVIVVLFISTLGPLLYLFWGRKDL